MVFGPGGERVHHLSLIHILNVGSGLSNAHGQAGVPTYDVFPSHRLMTMRGATSKPRCS